MLMVSFISWQWTLSPSSPLSLSLSPADAATAAQLHTVLEPFLLRRVKAEVLRELPKRSEVILYTGLSTVQKKLYKAILTKDIGRGGAR